MDAGGSSLPDSVSPTKFPAKLWRLVNNPEMGAICWDSSGEVIIVDKHLLKEHLLSPANCTTTDIVDAFKTTNFSSFVRQLNLYGFRRVDPDHHNHHRSGEAAVCYHFYNPNFNRNHPELVSTLRRLTVDYKAKAHINLKARGWSPGPCKRVIEEQDDKQIDVERGKLHVFCLPAWLWCFLKGCTHTRASCLLLCRSTKAPSAVPYWPTFILP